MVGKPRVSAAHIEIASVTFVCGLAGPCRCQSVIDWPCKTYAPGEGGCSEAAVQEQES